MFITETQIRVRYAETDQMNVVYYGNYAQYFEVARAESIRKLGFTYKEMEALGVIMPVVEMQTKYLRPAHYDDLLNIKTILRELPADHRILARDYPRRRDCAGRQQGRGNVTIADVFGESPRHVGANVLRRWWSRGLGCHRLRGWWATR